MPLAPSNYFFQTGVIPAYDQNEAEVLPITLAPSQTLTKGTVLGEQIGNNDVQTLSVTGTATGGTFTLTLGSYTTSALNWNATAAQVQAALLALPNLGSNNVQSLSLSSFTGGNIILSLGSNATAPIAYNAAASTVQTALAALPNIGSGNVTCTGGALNTTAVTITFQGNLANQFVPNLGLNTTQLQGAGTATLTQVGPGGPSNVSCTGGALPGTPVVVNFQNALGNQSVTAMTVASALTGTSSPAVINTHTTTGAAGTPGQYAAYNASNSDGSQIPKCILQFDVASDANGNLTFGWQTGGQGAGGFGQTAKTCPAFFKGYFRTQDLVGLDMNAVNLLGRLVQGDIAAPNGGIIRLT